MKVAIPHHLKVGVCICVTLYSLLISVAESQDTKGQDESAPESGPISGEKVAFLGDSITATGWMRPDGFIHLISQAFAMQEKNVEIIPAGKSGNTSKDILARLDDDVLKKKPDWLVLNCGLNDVWFGVNGIGLDQFEQNITSIVNQATAAGIKVVILTTTVIDEDPNSGNNQKLGVYNDFLRSFANDRSLPIADLYQNLTDAIAKQRSSNPYDDGNQLTLDGVHMNGLGDEVIAISILHAFKFTDQQVSQAEAAWVELPDAKALTPVALSIHQYAQIQAIASKQGCSVDNLMKDKWKMMLDQMINTNPDNSASPSPKASP
jgi:lysophospholipase L1-like esterase